MKILFIASQVYGNGGIPRFNRNLINASKQTPNAEVKVLSLNDASKDEVQGFNKSKPKFLGAIIKSLIFYRPQLIILGHTNFIRIASTIKKLNSGKLTCILHGIEAWEKLPFEEKLVKKVDQYWPVSAYTASEFVKFNPSGEGKIHQIFNTIPKTWGSEPKEIKDENFMFSVTRLDQSEGYKGIDKTINALGELKDLVISKGFKYKVVASGNDLDRHKQLVKDAGLEEIVSFQTGISDEELKSLYANCSFNILPSPGEGFGIVFLEAMAYKKACIGSLNCGSEDVIENNITGYLLEPNVEDIKKAIETLISNQNLRLQMGEAGYNKLYNQFTEEHFNKRIQEVICAES